MRRALLLLILAGCCGVMPARALLGETLKQLTQRNGKPQPQSRETKQVAIWMIEGEDGQLVFTVTFDKQGRSIGEGIKPVGFAKFSRAMVNTFIASELAPYRESKTLRSVPPGGKYVFGGKTYECAKDEKTIVDEANDILIVWNQGAQPSVIAASAALLR